MLAHFGKEGKPETVIPKISQDMLADMVGTTCSRVSLFLSNFQKLGLIDYSGGFHVDRSLLTIVLHDEGPFLLVILRGGSAKLLPDQFLPPEQY